MLKRFVFICSVAVVLALSTAYFIITSRYMTLALECADVYKIGQPVIVSIRGTFHGVIQRDWDRQYEIYEVDGHHDRRIVLSWSRLLYPRHERGERYFPDRSLDKDHAIYFLALVPRSTEPKRTVGVRMRWRDLGFIWRTVDSNVCVIRTETSTPEESEYFNHIADKIESWYGWPGLDTEAISVDAVGDSTYFSRLDIEAYLQSTNAVIAQHAMLIRVFGFLPWYFRSMGSSDGSTPSEALIAFAEMYDALAEIRGGNRAVRFYAEHMATAFRARAASLGEGARVSPERARVSP